MTSRTLINYFKRRFDNWIVNHPLEYENLTLKGINLFYAKDTQFSICVDFNVNSLSYRGRLVDILNNGTLTLLFQIHDFVYNCDLLTELINDDRYINTIILNKPDQGACWVREYYPEGVQIAHHIMNILGFEVIQNSEHFIYKAENLPNE